MGRRIVRARHGKDDTEGSANDGRLSVRPSYFGGNGVYAARPFTTGDVVGFFRGRLLRGKDLLSRPLAVQARFAKYMMTLGDINCVPCLDDGSVPRLPPTFAGCLINEPGVSRSGAHIHPNVTVAVPANAGLHLGCPYFGNRTPVLDWPVIALRCIKPNEELFLCYGESYGPRHYAISSRCAACA
jgi:hypothetical protein